MHGHLNVTISRCTVSWTSLYHDARSAERHYITMHGQLNVTISRCTVTWTSLYHDARSAERHYITMHGHLNVTLSNWLTARSLMSVSLVKQTNRPCHNIRRANERPTQLTTNLKQTNSILIWKRDMSDLYPRSTWQVQVRRAFRDFNYHHPPPSCISNRIQNFTFRFNF